MSAGIFDDASMVSTVIRVRDVAASVGWYREKLAVWRRFTWVPTADHPIAVYRIAGSVVSMWQLPVGQARVRDDNDRNTYVVIVMDGDLAHVRQALLDRGVDVGEIRSSSDNEFVWFHDPDGNRFELSRPLGGG